MSSLALEARCSNVSALAVLGSNGGHLLGGLGRVVLGATDRSQLQFVPARKRRVAIPRTDLVRGTPPRLPLLMSDLSACRGVRTQELPGREAGPDRLRRKQVV